MDVDFGAKDINCSRNSVTIMVESLLTLETIDISTTQSTTAI